jgi:hypothetical protein
MTERARHVAALFSALQFRDSRPEALRELDDSAWNRLLTYSDRAHLTLILGRISRDHLPGWVRDRIDRNLSDNTERVERIQRAYAEIAPVLQTAGAEHLVLKGFSQWPNFIPDLRLRMQSDIDLYCPGESLFRARDALLRIGYQRGRSPEHHLTDHLPVLVRRNGWKWRGNSFDPEMPPSVELHHKFWGASYTRFGPGDLAPFWDRRTRRLMGPIRFPALDTVDSFCYAALHALRHLLYGALLPSHIYELGFFLENNARNDALWEAWLDLHEDSLRSMAAIPALLAVRWFGCRLSGAVEAQIDRLPDVVHQWFGKFADSPLAGLFRHNKDALWLHLQLLGSAREKRSVLVRRLFPLWVPSLNSRWIQEKEDGGPPRRRWPMRNYFIYLTWFISRTLRHLRMIPLTLWHGLRLR